MSEKPLLDEVKEALEVLADRIETRTGGANALRTHLDLAARALLHAQHLPVLLNEELMPEEGLEPGACVLCGRYAYDVHDRTCSFAERMLVLDPTWIEREIEVAWSSALRIEELRQRDLRRRRQELERFRAVLEVPRSTTFVLQEANAPPLILTPAEADRDREYDRAIEGIAFDPASRLLGPGGRPARNPDAPTLAGDLNAAALTGTAAAARRLRRWPDTPPWGDPIRDEGDDGG